MTSSKIDKITVGLPEAQSRMISFSINFIIFPNVLEWKAFSHFPYLPLDLIALGQGPTWLFCGLRNNNVWMTGLLYSLAITSMMILGRVLPLNLELDIPLGQTST